MRFILMNGKKGSRADIANMVDQSHNLKGKIEAMIQTVCTAQELYAKATIVNHERLAKYSRAVLWSMRNSACATHSGKMRDR